MCFDFEAYNWKQSQLKEKCRQKHGNIQQLNLRKLDVRRFGGNGHRAEALLKKLRLCCITTESSTAQPGQPTLDPTQWQQSCSGQLVSDHCETFKQIGSELEPAALICARSTT